MYQYTCILGKSCLLCVLQSSSINEVIKKGQKSPYIILSGRKEQLQSFLVVDKSLVCECPLNNVPVILLSAFFSFNICYTPGCHNFFSFLEYVFLDYKTINFPHR